MSAQTPRPRAVRPSMNNNGINPSPSLLEKATMSSHRKASYNALVGQTPHTPAARILDDDFNIGDAVNVPGDMHGTVKFVGSVRGKQGRFLGVELDQDFAARGKNSGDVEGVSYFTTSIPGSGIFLPVHRAEKRDSPALSFGSVSQSPQTPSYSTHRNARPTGREPPLPTQPKFSQTVGPGARPPSPEFKPKSRQSLPRPESPFRKQPNLQPTPARNFSTSQRIGSRPPVASPAPARSGTPKLSASTRAPPPTRPYSRTGSRLGHRSESISESAGGGASRSTTSTYSRPLRSPSRLDRASDENEVARLREQLQEKDRLLQEQASTLVDMEASLKEIQTLIPSPNSRKTSGFGDEESDDMAQLRQALQEKNENIQSLVTEFDTHRADFRSTIDTLELAANQTEQMYENKIADLMAEMQDLRDNNTSREDVENIATQLKMLEEFVAELEEGLEDARRGEAEARGEVEFLRGEVERGRSELRREREKGASGRDEGGQSDLRTQLEMKDDEIRGLRAIVHSLQAGQDALEEPKRQSSTMQQEEIKRMQETIEQLEQENDDLRSQVHRPHGQFDGVVEHHDAHRSTDEPLPANTKQAGSSKTNGVTKTSTWCDACETEGHDMLHCPTLSRNPSGKHLDGANDEEHDDNHDDNHDELSRGIQGLGIKEMGDNHDVSPRSPQKEVAPTKAAVEQEKWCALCEQDGHLAFDCPNEQY